jgi:pyruvate kinase
MTLPDHKTKIVATIGPASDTTEIIERLIRAGMGIARLNFSHGAFEGHAATIRRIREAERATGRRVAIMADLPGPKMRIGAIQPDPTELQAGQPFVLTTGEADGSGGRVTVSFEHLARAVKTGDLLYLNDGLVQLRVKRIDGPDVHCTVEVGGELRSRKGLNLPGISLGIRAFTTHDRACLAFALAEGVDAVSQSFVETAADLADVRAAAADCGRMPFVIAKIERAGALRHADEILAAADGIMIARGDLGVEVPLEDIAVTQKDLIARANRAGKPVITATQMLESMVTSRLPTRAEATDVANAILDGTDAVMLSAESAMGRYPEEAVATLARIAAAAERHRNRWRTHGGWTGWPEHAVTDAADAISALTERALATVPVAAVVVPSDTGGTARMIARQKPPVWVVAPAPDRSTGQGLQFSAGVFPVEHPADEPDWGRFAAEWMHEHRVEGRAVLLVQGPSRHHPAARHRLEFIRIET